MTLEEFTIEIQKLFDLREEKKSGEKLTEAEYKKLGYFKEILNDFYKAKNSTEGLTRDVRKALADRYEVANALYLAAEGGAPLNPIEAEVTTTAPTLTVTTVEKLDVSNPNKYIRDATTAGLDVEAGTKTQEVSKQEGLVNEYAIIPNFIEELKKTIAQETSDAPVKAVETIVVTDVTDVGSTVTLAETLKTDVAQLISENEKLVVVDHPLYVLGKGIYTDFESQLHIYNVKQDPLDANSIFVDESLNPYDIPETYFGEVQVQLAAAEQVAKDAAAALQLAIAAEQATAIESYSGGG
jgi:hypothetical protein